MTGRCIVFTKPDGGVSIVRPALNARLAWLAEEPEAPANAHHPFFGAGPISSEVRRVKLPAFEHGPFRQMANLAAADAAGEIEWAETEDEFLARVMGKDVPLDAINPRIVDASALPKSREFRDAWTDEFDTPTVDVDMGRARDIFRDRLRDKRAPLLASLDVDYQRADEAGNAKAKREVTAKKQKLRDITADCRIEAAATPEDLGSLRASMAIAFAKPGASWRDG